jgi:hypothetical protein
VLKSLSRPIRDVTRGRAAGYAMIDFSGAAKLEIFNRVSLPPT